MQINQKLFRIIIEDIRPSGKVKQYKVQRIRDVRINLFQIYYSVIKDNVCIIRGKASKRRLIIFLKLLSSNVTPSRKIYKDIPQSEQIISKHVFFVPVVVVKIYPAVKTFALALNNMVTSYVSVFLSVIMKKFDGLYQINIIDKYCSEIIVEVIFMFLAEV